RGKEFSFSKGDGENWCDQNRTGDEDVRESSAPSQCKVRDQKATESADLTATLPQRSQRAQRQRDPRFSGTLNPNGGCRASHYQYEGACARPVSSIDCCGSQFFRWCERRQTEDRKRRNSYQKCDRDFSRALCAPRARCCGRS